LRFDYDVAIVGAGAAGLASAIFVRGLNPERSVALFDGAKRPGAKILVSGGGRCNVTNTIVSEKDFWGGRATVVRQVLRAFTVDQTRAFFSRIGVALHEEADGKLFPDSNRARDVLDALLREIDTVGVALQADRRVIGIVSDDGGFVISTSRGPATTRQVVLATGGRSLPKTGSDGLGYAIAESLGHTIVRPTPALAPLVLDDRADSLHTKLSGVAQAVELTVWVDGRVSIRLTGSLLWTHFGVSGPVVLNASRHWERASLDHDDVRITLNFFPTSTFDEIDARLITLIADRPRASIATLLSTFLPASVASALITMLGLDAAAASAEVTRPDRRRLAHALVEWTLPVTGTRGYNYAEATAGGVRLAEVDPRTMESRVCPGLYLVGEVLDVDGRIGGFNFQWAWSSAFVAARALAGLRGV
jgi:predicted Rossmann fold flavoprotein